MGTVARFEIGFTRYLSPDGSPEPDLPDFARDPATLLPLYRAMVLTRQFDLKAIAMQRTGQIGTFNPTCDHISERTWPVEVWLT